MPDADKEDALLVAVTRDGKVYFGNDQMPADQLTGKVKDRLANRVGQAGLRQSRCARQFGAVVEVVDNVRAAGVDQLGLLTEQSKKKAAPGSRRSSASEPDSQIARIRGESLWEWQWARAAVRTRTSTSRR